MESRIRDCQKLPVGERGPEERQCRQGEPRRRAQPRANRLRGAPYQDRGERQHEYPTGDRACASRQRVHHQVDDDAPDGRPDDETLRQRNPVVGLSQRHPRNDVADGRERN